MSAPGEESVPVDLIWIKSGPNVGQPTALSRMRWPISRVASSPISRFSLPPACSAKRRKSSGWRPVKAPPVPIVGEQKTQVGGDLIAAVESDTRRIVTVPVQVDIRQRQRLVPDGREILAFADLVQDRLDMLAGTQLAGREVGAGTVIGALGQGADLNLVGGLDRDSTRTSV